MGCPRVVMVPAILLPVLGWFAMAVLTQQPTEFRLGEWKATWRTYAPPSAVCDAEPQWLYDELNGLNDLLDAFLARGTTRGGAWSDAQVPMLEQAAKTLPAVVAAHDASLRALEKCPFAQSGLYPQLRERGLKLTAEAQTELTKLPELMKFTRQRGAVERWEKDRVAQEKKAKDGCAKKTPTIYFSWQDEYRARVWLFCDGAKVTAPDEKAFAVEGGDPRQGPAYIRAARFHPDTAMLKAPQAF